MESDISQEDVSFFTRVGAALKLLFQGDFARQVFAGLKLLEPKPAAAPAPEREQAPALLLLSALQREGRLLDFVQQDVSGYSDEEIGAAARVVHTGSKKILQEYFQFAPAVKDEEGAAITVPKGFDAQRIRLTGNVTGQPPFRGTLKHHGWVATQIKMPSRAETMDARILAPAEVELG